MHVLSLICHAFLLPMGGLLLFRTGKDGRDLGADRGEVGWRDWTEEGGETVVGIENK